MKNKSKMITSAIIALALACSMFATAFASDTTFTKKYVDSNTYTQITSLCKDRSTDYATVTVSNIYKANGSASTYTTVYAKATDYSTVKTVYKGTPCNLPIPTSYRGAGHWISLYAKNTNSSLDCMISGSYCVY